MGAPQLWRNSILLIACNLPIFDQIKTVMESEPNAEHLDLIETRKILNVKWSNHDDSIFREF